MKFLLPLGLLLLYWAGPQCEVRGAADAGHDSGRDSGGKGPGDGGSGPDDPDSGFPGSGKHGDPGTDVLYLVRMDRGLANDANDYQQLVDQVRDALTGAGLKVIQEGVASLQDGQLLWGRTKDEKPPVSLSEALSFDAQQATDQFAPCSTTGLANLGANIPFALLTYPPELTGLPWYEQPFTVRPGALLVVLIDHDVRPATPSSPDCQVAGMAPADWFGGGAYPQWLAWQLPRPTTRFWTIFTPEDGRSQAQMRSDCLAEGFLPSALDVISVSPVPFYEPWGADMNLYSPDLVTRADFCPSMAGTFPARALADAWVKVLRAQAGLP